MNVWVAVSIRAVTIVFLVVAAPSLAFTTRHPGSRQHVASRTILSEGDGNPPPFGSFGAPAPAPPSPVAPDAWATPAVAPPTPATDGWGSASSWSAPAPPPPATAVAPSTFAAPTAVSGDNPIAVFAAAQASNLASIQESIPDLNDKGVETIDLGNSAAATIHCYEAPGPSNVAWLSDVIIPGQLVSLTVFNGPLTSLPHLQSRVMVKDNLLHVSVDVRPRAYGAYETKRPDGTYPGPEELGRVAFEYSGNRNEFLNEFTVPLLQDAALEGATKVALNEFDLLTSGPFGLYVTAPISPANVQQLVDIRNALVAHWLEWRSKDQYHHRPGAPINTQYVYDSKFRQNAYCGLRDYYNGYFDAGNLLAEKESGPLDEGYVGGGS